MIGGFINKKGVRFVFEMGVCETCGKGGKIAGTFVKNQKQTTTFMLSKVVPTLFEKEDIRGRRYDRLCAQCIERIEMIEAKIAGEREVSGQ